MDNFAIWTKNLTKKFGDFVSVDNISIQVEKGDIFGFIGANGAGKTTTIRMLCGILDPTSGEGKVAGYDIFKEQEKIKENIGYMSQKFSLYNDLTVEENINFYCGAYKLSNQERKIAKERAYQISELKSLKDTLTRDLPVGWKQRLALSCALLHNPQIVFLDEPTAGVDPISRRKFWDLIYELSSEGITVFVTTHFLDEAEHCTKIGLIDNGKIIAQDTPSRLKNFFDFDIYEVFSSDNLKLCELINEEKICKSAFIFGNSIHIVNDKDQKIREDILSLSRKNFLEVYSISQIHPTLEDVFINLIEEKQAFKND
ncbi:MAG: ABC transporter ATP-binding protein [Ignavibacteria bacterium]|jgi:ABC-2 type transport system ATP-binding protein|nr:ABC transporter ATP-binding protein [Ignavibacteria bacterium]MDH7528884.1 ABC transporter ATP-binding protein [Ignavibacteria bacterium]